MSIPLPETEFASSPDDAGMIRLGTRASLLARTQSATIGNALADISGVAWQEVLIRTHGDDTAGSLDQPGRPGVFVSALRDALLDGRVDVIVHSYKDLPSAPEPGLVLAAVPIRADARDGLVSRDALTLQELPPGAIVGTSSPRRAAAIASMRPDLLLRPIRGNVDSRIGKVRSGEFDATILAVAGVTRIGREAEFTEILDDLLPAPAQGALAVECRADDHVMREWLAQLDDREARLITAAEREVLVGIDAACTTAIAASGELSGQAIRLRAQLTRGGVTTNADVLAVVVDERSARVAGLRAAAALMGATKDRLPVLLIRSEGNDSDSESLDALGVPAISDPYVQIAPRRGGDDARRLQQQLSEATPGQWLVVTSPMAVPSWAAAIGESELLAAGQQAAAAGMRAAATGERTAQTLRAIGFTDVLVPDKRSAQGVVDALVEVEPGMVLFPAGNLALRTLPEGLRDRGWTVSEGVVYDTQIVDDEPASTALIAAGEVSAVVLRSPSAVRGLLNFVTPPASVLVVCAGDTTAQAARDAGLRVDEVAASPSSADVAKAVAAALA